MNENEFVKVPLWFFNFLACPINQLAGVESKQLEEELEKKGSMKIVMKNAT